MTAGILLPYSQAVICQPCYLAERMSWEGVAGDMPPAHGRGKRRGCEAAVRHDPTSSLSLLPPLSGKFGHDSCGWAWAFPRLLSVAGWAFSPLTGSACLWPGTTSTIQVGRKTGRGGESKPSLFDLCIGMGHSMLSSFAFPSSISSSLPALRRQPACRPLPWL